ncbi:MAG TPA: hypothetical protein PLU30_16685 [Verrucomicrobiae bacterium]|nr:hypothetical protein [Verrucomicrobiae bacterium]
MVPFLALLPLAAAAAPGTWWTNGSASWFTTGNWSAGVPDSSTYAFITNGGTAQIAGGAAVANVLDIQNGMLSLTGGSLDLNGLIATNGASSDILVNGGWLTSRGSTMSNLANFVIGDTGGGATFEAQGGAHAFANNLVVGNISDGNQMLVTTGAMVANGIGYIGNDSASSGNAVLVTGTGSLWTNRGELYVGRSGWGNSLTISNGGVVNNNHGYVGNYAGASNNAVLVTGSGSLWINRGELNVGNAGSGNSLTISNGGFVQNVNSRVGNASGSNAVIVTGGGSVWTNGNAMYLGVSGSSNNKLTISDGGVVFDFSADIGWSSCTRNTATVTGTGSVWNSGGSLSVGSYGWDNALTISNGGAVHDNNGYVGYNAASASNNTVLVTGTGSVWSNRSDLTVGNAGSGNSLTVADGAVVHDNNGYVGYQTSTTNNAVWVTGGGSLWSNRSDLYVGNYGSGNSLTVSNGGIVHDNNGFVGYNTSSSSNAVWVTGGGSLWTNRSDLTVGYSGKGNSLTISNGGAVAARNVYISSQPAATGNVIRIDGGILRAVSNVTVGAAGSLEVASGTLDVGRMVTNRGSLSGAGTFKALQIVNERQATFTGNAQIQAGYRNSSGATTEVAHATGAVFQGPVTNAAGAVFKNTGGLVQFLAIFENQGLYASDPATNQFTTFSVGPGGSVAGGAGDLFEFDGDFLNKSTNAAAFDLASAEVAFAGGGSHIFELAGVDLGANAYGYASNFAIGVLTLGAGDVLTLLDGNTGNAGTALYVGVFNADTNSITSAFNIYYDADLNLALGGGTYELNGGGFLIAIPEPGPIFAVMASAAALLGLRRFRR